MQLGLLHCQTFFDAGVDLINRHRRIYRPDMHHCFSFLSMQVLHPSQRFCPVEPQNKRDVLKDRPLLIFILPFTFFLLPFSECHSLPILPLVLSQVQHIKWLAILGAQQPFTCHVNCPT